MKGEFHVFPLRRDIRRLIRRFVDTSAPPMRQRTGSSNRDHAAPVAADDDQRGFTYDCFRDAWKRECFGGIQHLPEFLSWTWRRPGKRAASMYDLPNAVAADPVACGDSYAGGVGGLRWVELLFSCTLGLLDGPLSPGAALGVLFTLYTLYETQPRRTLQTRAGESCGPNLKPPRHRTTALGFCATPSVCSPRASGNRRTVVNIDRQARLAPARIRVSIVAWQRLLRVVVDAQQCLPKRAGDHAQDILKIMCRRRQFTFAMPCGPGGIYGRRTQLSYGALLNVPTDALKTPITVAPAVPHTLGSRLQCSGRSPDIKGVSCALGPVELHFLLPPTVDDGGTLRSVLKQYVMPSPRAALPGLQRSLSGWNGMAIFHKCARCSALHCVRRSPTVLSRREVLRALATLDVRQLALSSMRKVLERECRSAVHGISVLYEQLQPGQFCTLDRVSDVSILYSGRRIFEACSRSTIVPKSKNQQCVSSAGTPTRHTTTRIHAAAPRHVALWALNDMLLNGSMRQSLRLLS